MVCSVTEPVMLPPCVALLIANYPWAPQRCRAWYIAAFGVRGITQLRAPRAWTSGRALRSFAVEGSSVQV